MSRYRDDPQPSFEVHRHYDSSPQHIPLGTTTYGPGGNLYNQTAMKSTQDVYNHGGVDHNYNRSEQWLEASNRSGNRSKWIVLGSIAALIGLIAIGVVVGVVVSKNTHNRTGASGSVGSGSSPVVQSNPNDPSTFIKDPRLHQSFYGMAYTPAGSQLPNCGNTLGDVITDIQLISQLTTRIRLYGADCNQSALVLEAIKQTKVNLEVYLGNYAIATDNGTAYQRQRDEIKAAIQTYGTDHIAGITVGNEFMLNYITENANAQADINGAIANQGAAILIADIQDTRQMLSGMGLTGKMPVGTSDAGSYFNNKVLAAIDYGMANVHPWFGNVSITDAAAWTNSFFQTTDVDLAKSLPNNPAMWIAETGWPTNSSDASNESNGPSTASVPNLQTFLDTFICQANTNNTGYFFFEYFDEPWKDVEFGGVEGWWGLFTSGRQLKNITIPNCPTS